MTEFLNTSKRSAGKLGMVGAVIAKDLSFLVATWFSVNISLKLPLGQRSGHWLDGTNGARTKTYAPICTVFQPIYAGTNGYRNVLPFVPH